MRLIPSEDTPMPLTKPKSIVIDEECGCETKLPVCKVCAEVLDLTMTHCYECGEKINLTSE